MLSVLVLKCYCCNLSNLNYKPQAESHQHPGLYVDHYVQSAAIMIEVTSHHMECTHFNLDYSQMPAAALYNNDPDVVEVAEVATLLL